MVVRDFNSNTQETEAGRCIWVWGQAGPQSEFLNNLGCYAEKPCLERRNKNLCMNNLVRFGKEGKKLLNNFETKYIAWYNAIDIQYQL